MVDRGNVLEDAAAKKINIMNDKATVNNRKALDVIPRSGKY